MSRRCSSSRSRSSCCCCFHHQHANTPLSTEDWNLQRWKQSEHTSYNHLALNKLQRRITSSSSCRLGTSRRHTHTARRKNAPRGETSTQLTTRSRVLQRIVGREGGVLSLGPFGARRRRLYRFVCFWFRGSTAVSLSLSSVIPSRS